MHFNFNFSAEQILWTLTFAAQLVLLVVLLGRDRIKNFPWFTASIVLFALRLLATRELFGRMAPLTLSIIFIVLADVGAIVGLLVLIEMARRAFKGAPRNLWIVNAAGLLIVGGGVLAFWGPWPAWKTLTANSEIGVLHLMELIAQKLDLLVDLLTIELGLIVVLFGRHYTGGWRTHVQKIVIGLSTASVAQIAVQAIWQVIAKTAVPHSRAEYDHILGLREKIYNASGATYIAVLIWWIVWLWIDESQPKETGGVVTGLPVLVEEEEKPVVEPVLNPGDAVPAEGTVDSGQ
jgi:hypothetical protein